MQGVVEVITNLVLSIKVEVVESLGIRESVVIAQQQVTLAQLIKVLHIGITRPQPRFLQ